MEQKIYIEPTDRSPLIHFNAHQCLLEIKGRSIMENSKKFYEPIIGNWLNEYIEQAKEHTTVNIELEYFNSSSSIWIFQLFRKLQKLYKKTGKVVINWYYTDEDNLEAGEDYQPLTSIPFNLIEVEGYNDSNETDS